MKAYLIIRSLNSPDYEQRASRDGMIGAQLVGGQEDKTPTVCSMESKSLKRKKGGGWARVSALAPIFDMSLSLTTDRGVTLPPNSVTPVNFISKLSIDRHKGAYDVAETVLGDPLEGIVVPEGIYPTKGQNVRVLVANNGTEGKLLLPGQRLEGLAVSRTRGHAKPPSPAPRAAAAQNSEPQPRGLPLCQMGRQG